MILQIAAASKVIEERFTYLFLHDTYSLRTQCELQYRYEHLTDAVVQRLKHAITAQRQIPKRFLASLLKDLFVKSYLQNPLNKLLLRYLYTTVFRTISDKNKLGRSFDSLLRCRFSAFDITFYLEFLVFSTEKKHRKSIAFRVDFSCSWCTHVKRGKADKHCASTNHEKQANFNFDEAE
jgi:hypothetical protein